MKSPARQADDIELLIRIVEGVAKPSPSVRADAIAGAREAVQALKSASVDPMAAKATGRAG